MSCDKKLKESNSKTALQKTIRFILESMSTELAYRVRITYFSVLV